MPGLRYRLQVGLWTIFIVFNCQVVERALIFASPVFKNPGIIIIRVIIKIKLKISLVHSAKHFLDNTTRKLHLVYHFVLNYGSQLSSLNSQTKRK